MASERAKRRRFEEEALPHLDALYGTAVRLTRSAAGAEDLVQDTYLRAYRFWDTFKDGSNCRAWLFKILRNTFINHYQKSKRRREIHERAGAEQRATDGVLAHEDALIHRSPEQLVADTTVSTDVSDALAALPEDFRTAVVLCDVEGFSYKEIAEIMDCPVGTVMSRLYRGRRMLKQSLQSFAVREGIIPDNLVEMERFRSEKRSKKENA